MLGGALPAMNGLVPSDSVFRRNHVCAAGRLALAELECQESIRAEERPAGAGRGQSVRDALGRTRSPATRSCCTPRGRARRGAVGGGRGRDLPLQRRPPRGGGAVQPARARRRRRERPAAARAHRRQPDRHAVDRGAWGGNGNFMQIGRGAVGGDLVEHNTVVQSGNVHRRPTAGTTRRAQAPASGSCSATTSRRHNANGVIGQGLGDRQRQRSAVYFPGASVPAERARRRPSASRYPADNFFPSLDWLSQQFQSTADGDYRLRATSALRQSASNDGELGVSFTALADAFGADAPAWLKRPETP